MHLVKNDEKHMCLLVMLKPILAKKPSSLSSTDNKKHSTNLATVLVAMWSRVQEWSRGRGSTWNENIQLINIHNVNIG